MPPEAEVTEEQELEEQNSEDQQSTEQEQTTSTSNQQNQPTDVEARLRQIEEENNNLKNYRRLLEEQLGVQNRTIQQYQNQPPTAQQQQVEEDDPTEFFKKPQSEISGIIQREVREAVAPLMEFVQGYRATAEIDKKINHFKSVPELAGKIDGVIENHLRQIFSQPGAQLNDETFKLAVFSTLGMRAAGMLGDSNPAPTQQPTQPVQENKMTVPPHIRPTNPAAAKLPAGGTNKQPTEIEKKIMRMNGFKDYNEYLQWMDMKASDVAFTDLGQKKEGA
jgi:hypothetical protein